MVNSVEFAKRLEKIFEFYGLSATAFSEAIQFNRSTISHQLYGRNKPSLEFVMKVLQTFPEVELQWLLNGKGQFPSQKKVVTPLPVSSTHSSTPSSSEKSVSSTPVETANIPEHPEAAIEKIIIFYKDGSFKAYKP